MFYYYNTTVANYYALGDFSKALNILKKANTNEVITKTPSFAAFIYMNQALIYWKQKKFLMASKNTSRLLLQEDFDLLDDSFQLNLRIFDLIMKTHIKDYESIKNLIKVVKKNYKSLLDSNNYMMENDFVNLILKISDDSALAKDFTSFVNRYKNLKKDYIICYKEWIRDNYIQ